MINWVCRAFEAGSDTFSCRSMVFLVCFIQTPISYVTMWCCATGSNQLYTTLIDPSVVNDRAILTLRFVETHLKWSLICLEVEKWLLLLFDFFYFFKSLSDGKWMGCLRVFFNTAGVTIWKFDSQVWDFVSWDFVMFETRVRPRVNVTIELGLDLELMLLLS